MQLEGLSILGFASSRRTSIIGGSAMAETANWPVYKFHLAKLGTNPSGYYDVSLFNIFLYPPVPVAMRHP